MKINSLIKVALSPGFLKNKAGIAHKDLWEKAREYMKMNGTNSRLPRARELENIMNKRFKQRNKFNTAARKLEGSKF